ncbi:MAG: UDP-N-acetylglucosamine 2-epimerase (hydrolyzing) [Porticoccus sp.]|jgi:GDP/UDP-N,N'-diacetylbacillosamine 2-epimerase (hydrolysing)|nr:UDP-N-acetylglucosamine 2-epimerase (hydrolyzing) [Porticoccus sp.]|tara:strand:- start:21 stop:1175 length:1155 start_codon:yes stop_codon:yes gene_type:complete
MKKVCVVSGSRAEYGLLVGIIEKIDKSKILGLQLVITGTHLSSDFGYTASEIEADGFQIDHRIETLLVSNTSVGVTKSLGRGIIGFADALAKLKPDLLLVLGDRFEIFAAASAAMIACIPIAHLHGGEITEGAFDEAIRHSITKMSHIHFVAAQDYQRRVIQLGENPDNVHLVGGLGVDSINRQKLLSSSEIQEALGLKFGEKNLLITFHPVTLELSSNEYQMSELLLSLASLKNTQLIFTMPNADTGGLRLTKQIKEFVSMRTNAYFFESLGRLRYLSCVNYMDGVIGNSSSGLLEVPTFKKGTINIGSRQKGRLKASSVIDCEPDHLSINRAIETLYSSGFQSKLKATENPYGKGGASETIVDILEKIDFDISVKKIFYDLS